jgi:hypothetical protein
MGDSTDEFFANTCIKVLKERQYNARVTFTSNTSFRLINTNYTWYYITVDQTAWALFPAIKDWLLERKLVEGIEIINGILCFEINNATLEYLDLIDKIGE